MDHQAIRDAQAGPRDTAPHKEWDWLRPLATMPTDRRNQPPGVGQGGYHRVERAKYWEVTDPDWEDHAACNGVPAEVFFPQRGDPSTQAKEICGGCPVRDDCLAAAMLRGEKWGIWGGLSERERRQLRKTVMRTQPVNGGSGPQPIKHGTTNGYAQEYRRGIPRCQECKDAHNRSGRARYNGEHTE
jgi:WhiB family redox-sensing transcriptional regulator